MATQVCSLSNEGASGLGRGVLKEYAAEQEAWRLAGVAQGSSAAYAWPGNDSARREVETVPRSATSPPGRSDVEPIRSGPPKTQLVTLLTGSLIEPSNCPVGAYGRT